MSKFNTFDFNWIKYVRYFTLKLLVLLLITDLLFILIHCGSLLPESNYINIFLAKNVIDRDLLLITEDRSYAEVFQYIKEFWIILLLGFGYWQRKKFLFLAWSLLFGYLLLDDSLSIHEKIGGRISYLFQDAFRLRAVDYGEVLVSAIVGIFFLILITWGYYQSNFMERKYGKFLIIFLLILAIPGVLLDLIHIMVHNNYHLDLIFALLEDGGEHIVMSLVLAFVYTIDWQY